MKKRTRKVRINRGRWINAGVIKKIKEETQRHNVYSSLVDSQTGLKCCLGFCVQQVGKAPTQYLKDVGMPSHVRAVAVPRNIDHIIEVEATAASLNDESKIKVSKIRERRIAKVLRKAGIKVEFYGRQADAVKRAVARLSSNS